MLSLRSWIDASRAIFVLLKLNGFYEAHSFGFEVTCLWFILKFASTNLAN